MIQHGSPPYLECSSRGEKRLSAFHARIKGRSNASIEDLYQASKRFEDGSTGLHWREAKGRKPVNFIECSNFYSLLWEEYIEENPDLLDLVKSASGLSDIFGQVGHCCQATELWNIRNSPFFGLTH